MFIFVLGLFGCQLSKSGYIVSSTGAILESGYDFDRVIVVTPTTPFSAKKVIVEVLSAKSMKVVELRGAYSAQRDDFLIIDCHETGQGSEQGVYSVIVECVIKHNNRDKVLYKGQGEYAVFARGAIKELGGATRAAMAMAGTVSIHNIC